MPLEIRIMAASRALRVEKPALSAVHGRMDVNFNIAEKLEAARKRVARIDRSGFGEEIGAALEPPALTIDAFPDEKKRV